MAFILICSVSFRPLHAGEWIRFESNPTKYLRGYDTSTFPPANWSQDGSCFKLDSHGFGSDLMTKEVFSEFELEFDWKVERGGNSGVLFWVQTGEVYSYMTGLEIQLLDDAHHPDGRSSMTSLGSLYGLSAPMSAPKEKLYREGMNFSRIVVKDQRARFYLNQALIADHSLAQEELQAIIKKSKFNEIESFYKKNSGHILFQDHGGKVSYCNIRIRPL
jgi:hypothetical protein